MKITIRNVCTGFSLTTTLALAPCACATNPSTKDEILSPDAHGQVESTPVPNARLLGLRLGTRLASSVGGPRQSTGDQCSLAIQLGGKVEVSSPHAPPGVMHAGGLAVWVRV